MNLLPFYLILFCSMSMEIKTGSSKVFKTYQCPPHKRGYSFTPFYDLYSFIFSLKIYFEYGSIYSGGSWKKIIYDIGLWRWFVVGNILSFKNTTWISNFETCSEEIPWGDALTQTLTKIPSDRSPNSPYTSCLLKTFINRKIWIISTFLQRAVTMTDLTLYLHRG